MKEMEQTKPCLTKLIKYSKQLFIKLLAGRCKHVVATGEK